MLARRSLLAALCALTFAAPLAHAQPSPATAAPSAPASTLIPFPEPLLARALAEPAPRWKFSPGKRYHELPHVFALQLLALSAHFDPLHPAGDSTLAAAVAAKIRTFLVSEPDADGNTREPEALGGLGGWSHNSAAQILLLARRTPAVWDALSPEEHRRADLLMHAFAIAGHFTLDDDNDFGVLLDGVALYQKSWNPNIVEGYVDVMTAASLYFGADELNAFFRTFDFDAFTEQLRIANFRNVLRCWTHTPAMRDLLMNGGTFRAPGESAGEKLGGTVGHGAGVRNDFTYLGYTLAQPWELYRTQANRQFCKTARTIVTICGDNRTHLLQRASAATLSPFEGQIGMCAEFESTDWNGMRSSTSYAFEGSMLQLSIAATLHAIGAWRDDAAGRSIAQRMSVGIGDLLFKAREGYRGWSLGQERIVWLEQDLQPLGSDYIFPLWTDYLAREKSSAAAPAATPSAHASGQN
ncbi:hypothetical protein K0B96_00110 [Horticoccus luteus]|uniref:Alginate lyase domain-containing protein n=1 Tax=Horticoccus luteus TaxID=2862869 RepID=A0A8F9TWI2_9BACT|nr:hypothetical protein [Horticoccus luteus]QYM79053.1 hypothetical protein K0B96_00110 [Horticoccus luteus]